MKDQMLFWVILFTGLAIGFIVGNRVGVVVEGNKWKEKAINLGFAHYDTKTGAFTFNEGVKP